MYNVTFQSKNITGQGSNVPCPGDVTVSAVPGETILDAARRAGVAIDALCSGNGTCGKCRVKLVDTGGRFSVSSFSAHNDINIAYDDTENRPPVSTEGWCLACTTTIDEDITVFVPEAASDYIKNIEVKILAPPTKLSSYGLAIDIGTTTVSAMIADLETNTALTKATTGNAQIRYGADVINRIIEQQKPGGVVDLQNAILNDTLYPLIECLCDSIGTNTHQIQKITIAANTTMNHLLLGINANSIRLEPYKPVFLACKPYHPSRIGINAAQRADMHLAPNIGSYVGGDITAGVLASGIWDNEAMSLLIDLGTNGEIVFGNNDFLMACACSAGPAFEGGDIDCGMRASAGAVSACIIEKETMTPQLTIIGENKPAGICGSGLIDIIAELFRHGIINGKGKFDRESDRIKHDEYGTGSYILVHAADSATGIDITLTETDIDNFIRAKGAIFSGIMSLLSPLGFTPADIDRIMVAGGIGSGINIDNAISIGMLPDLPADKYSYIGNSSLDGAYAMLISQDNIKKVHEIADNMTYIELSSQPGYMDEFIAACFLPHTDETLFPGRS